MGNLSILVKPASSGCNMRCRYCFYYDVAQHRSIASYGIMTMETTDSLLEKAFEEVGEQGELSVMFQGGEPCVAGIEYFRYFTSQADKFCPKGVAISYAIQTNGSVIDENWCRMFARYKFLVGISLDGYEQLHDNMRFTKNLEGTYQRVMKSVRLLQKYQIEYNVLTVVTKETTKYAMELYRFYKEQKIAHVQLIPCLRPLEGGGDEGYYLDSKAYGRFLKEIFNLWYGDIKNGYYTGIRQFDNIVWMLKGRYPEMCGMTGQCSLQYVIESDGSVYPCDFYVLDQYQCGNVRSDRFNDIRQHPNARKFLQHTVVAHSLCDSCKVKPLCGGGCKRYRSFYAEDNNYCPNQDFLYHTYEQFIHVASMV